MTRFTARAVSGDEEHTDVSVWAGKGPEQMAYTGTLVFTVEEAQAFLDMINAREGRPPVEGIDTAPAVRQGLIELRDQALAQAAFNETALLTHAIAWMSLLGGEA